MSSGRTRLRRGEKCALFPPGRFRLNSSCNTQSRDRSLNGVLNVIPESWAPSLTSRTQFLKAVVGFWWISWFGFLAAFLWIGWQAWIDEYRRHSPGIYFSTVLLALVSLSWIVFFIVDDWSDRKNSSVILLTTMGTFLAFFTLLGIYYFSAISPRVQ